MTIKVSDANAPIFKEVTVKSKIPAKLTKLQEISRIQPVDHPCQMQEGGVQHVRSVREPDILETEYRGGLGNGDISSPERGCTATEKEFLRAET